MGRRVFITVAEVSGDRHAAQLVTALRQLDPTLVIEGLGGPEMAEAGAIIHHETVSNAAMGWRGALRLLEVRKLLQWTERHFEQNRPDIQIGVDSPSMNFHFAKLAKRMGIPVMQYVAPQLWAWREGRMKKVRRWIDRLACVLPFEEAYFRKHGVNATFVGHPLFDELPERREHTNGELKFPERPPVIGLLPGSRRSEAERNFSGLLEAAQLIQREFPEAKFLVPTTAATHPVVEELVRQSSASLRNVNFERDAFDEMVPRCDLCLTVSGTATLHVAGFGVPMIVVYRSSRASWDLLGRWLINTRTFALVNVLAAGPNAAPDRHIVPEFVPWFGDAKPVAKLAIDFLRDPAKLSAQRVKLDELVGSLDHPGASMNVAKMALEMLDVDKKKADADRLTGAKVISVDNGAGDQASAAISLNRSFKSP
jgi:lipid-A-disaccharide synthase